MYWSSAVIHDASLLARTGEQANARAGWLDAYQCVNGHTSPECPLCGSYDTSAWADAAPSRHYHVICASCGNDSVVGL